MPYYDPDPEDAPDSIEGCGYCAWCDAFVEADQWWGDLCKKCGEEAQETVKDGHEPLSSGLKVR
jgi:hypothetical protein